MDTEITKNVRRSLREARDFRIEVFVPSLSLGDLCEPPRPLSLFKERKKLKILILCTGNSCRSQMAEGFLKSFDPEMNVFSAGTNPSSHVHPKAVQVMREVGIDISDAKPEDVAIYLDQSFDYVITVCGNAKETCPAFIGDVNEQLHIGFDDPADASGTEDEILDEFRRVRDEIKRNFRQFYERVKK